MIRKLDIEGLHCHCSSSSDKSRIAYILYPLDILSDWIEPASKKYGVTIVVITGMDWETVFSPWPAPAVPKGGQDFKGGSPDFLCLLQHKVIPQVETALGINEDVERSLVGVSMSGLFALWQWIECDIFSNIASLSGSFWYEGFVDWLKNNPIPQKSGIAYFLLGDQESKSKVKEFARVSANTAEVIGLLRAAGIKVTFESVSGGHTSNPIERLDKAFVALYPKHRSNHCDEE